MMAFGDFEKYENRYLDVNYKSYFGIGFFIQMIPFLICLIALAKLPEDMPNQRLLVFIASLGYLTIPFTQIVPLISRMGIYFNIYGLGAMPLAYGSIKRRDIKLAVLILFVFITSYNYIAFFDLDSYRDSYHHFDTIFSVLL